MTFLTILGLSEILCSFRLVLEGKTGKKIPESSRLEILETFPANNFTLSDAEEDTSELLNRWGIFDLPLLKTLLAIHQKSQEPRFWEVIGSFVLLAYANLAASGTFLQQLLAFLNFTLESEDLSFWYKRKKWFLWIMTAGQAVESLRDEWGLTWYFLWGIHKSTHSQKFISSSRSTKFNNILPWNISQMTIKTVPISTRIIISYAVKRGIPFWICWKVSNEEIETTAASEEINKSKRAGLWEPESGIRVGKVTIWVSHLKL